MIVHQLNESSDFSDVLYFMYFFCVMALVCTFVLGNQLDILDLRFQNHPT